ncbi:MAG: homoserine kinase [Alphaproteobacteria bacterium]|nr:homoserine kinase [Alphaproteobacteria bacterium]
MAVYTRITDHELSEFVNRYAIGKVIDVKDILSGVENSNFFLTTETGKYILTIYEKRTREEDLPFFINLMRHIAAKGIPCPAPITDKKGAVLQRLAGKPAALVSFLNGNATHAVSVEHCRQVGVALAQMHIATADFMESRANNLSLEGWAGLITRCLEKGDTVQPGLTHNLVNELKYLVAHWPDMGTMPYGVIHADLFPDNVFFEKDKLCGLIDFYFACSDFLAYDLAVSMNAWCFNDAHQFQALHAQAMMDGYQSVRKLDAHEKKTMPVLLRGASLRFLLTRLYDLLNHPKGALVKPKDPLEYAAKLKYFQSFPYEC